MAAALPELTDPTLRRAVAGAVAEAERLRRRLAALGELAQAAQQRGTQQRGTQPARVPEPDDRLLGEALAGLTDHPSPTRRGDPDAPRTRHLLAQIRGLTTILADPATDDWIPACPLPWTQLLRGLGAVALRAASPVTAPAQREALAGLLHALAASPFGAADPRIRILDATFPASKATEGGARPGPGPRTVIVLPGRGRGGFDGHTWRGPHHRRRQRGRARSARWQRTSPSTTRSA